MVLVFWLVILFLDGALSSQKVLVVEVPNSENTLVSWLTEESLQEKNIYRDTDSVVHAIAPDQKVSEMIEETVHQQLGSSEVFKDLNVLEYLYNKNKNTELLQPMIKIFTTLSVW